jgi:outer membrane protein
MLQFSKSSTSERSKWAQKGAECKEQQLSYAQQALSQQLQQESGTEMDTLVSGVKNSSKLTVRKKDTLISMELVCFYFVC